MDKIGILWDLDGTIVDSVILYYEAYRGVYEKYRRTLWFYMFRVTLNQ